MQGRGNARFPCTPSSKPTSTTNKNRLAARTGKKLGCGNDARWNPWKSPTPTFPPLPPHLEIPQQTRDSHIPTATTTTGYRGLEQHQTKFNTKINTNNKTKVVYTDNLTHPIHQSPRTQAYGFFAKGTVPTSHILTQLVSFLFLTIFGGCLPRPTCVAGCPVTRLSPRFIGTIQPADY